jgi:hypothetical protein
LESGLALATGFACREGRGIDVDHHLVAVAPGPRVEVVSEGGLGDEAEGVGPPLGAGGVVPVDCFAGFLAEIEEALFGSIEGAEENGPDLGGESTANDHHPIFVDPGRETPAGMPTFVVVDLSLTVDPPPGADETFDVGRGTGFGEDEQLFFIVGSGDPGDGANLGVGEAAFTHRLGDAWEVGEGARHADLLASGGQAEPGAPMQPMSAGVETAVPAGPKVELVDHDEKLVGGGLDLGGV